MTSAALATSGLLIGSNFTRYWRPAASLMRKPGVMPSFLAATTVHLPDAGGRELPAPVFSSSTLIRRVACRLVYHALSGTSSTVLTACDGSQAPVWGARWPGAKNVLSLIHISEPTRLLSISYAVF